jgi:hypothetical protein
MPTFELADYFHKIFCHYRQSEPPMFSFHKPVITTHWKHKLVWQEVAKWCKVTSSGHNSIVIGTILIQNERQGNGSCK